MEIKQKEFTPRAGQIDYTNLRWAPVVNCVVRYNGKILLVRRHKNLRLYPSVWNGISGFLDDEKSLENKVREELREEIGLHGEDIKSIKLGQIFDQEEPKYKKTWIVHPVLVEVATDTVKLDWEAQEYKWVTIKEAMRMELIPGFKKVLKSTVS